MTYETGSVGGRGPTTATRGMHPSQWLALIIGTVYTLIGIVGLFITGFSRFAEVTGKTLLGFEINPLHSLVHLVVGLAGLTLFRRLAGARTYGWLLLVAYGAVFIYGLFAVSRDDINWLSLNTPDNWLHLITALAGLLIALWPARDHTPAADATTGSTPPQ